MTKAPYGQGPFMTSSPENWHGQSGLLVTAGLGTPVYLAIKVHTCKCTVQTVKTTERILTDRSQALRTDNKTTGKTSSGFSDVHINSFS